MNQEENHNAQKTLGEKLNLNVRCTVAHPLRLSQLSANGWGAGMDSRGRTHLLLLEERMKPRKARQFLCQRRARFDVSEGDTTGVVTCPECLKLLKSIAERG